MLVKVSGEKLSAVSSQFSGNALIPAQLPHSELLDQFEITARIVALTAGKKVGTKTRAIDSKFQESSGMEGIVVIPSVKKTLSSALLSLSTET